MYFVLKNQLLKKEGRRKYKNLKPVSNRKIPFWCKIGIISGLATNTKCLKLKFSSINRKKVMVASFIPQSNSFSEND